MRPSESVDRGEYSKIPFDLSSCILSTTKVPYISTCKTGRRQNWILLSLKKGYDDDHNSPISYDFYGFCRSRIRSYSCLSIPLTCVRFPRRSIDLNQIRRDTLLGPVIGSLLNTSYPSSFPSQIHSAVCNSNIVTGEPTTLESWS